MAILPTQLSGPEREVISKAVINPEIFEKTHDDIHFWIGRAVTSGVVENPEFFNAVTQFRANVYVHELGFLPAESVDGHGREIDSDDRRSTHFLVVERGTGSETSAQSKVVGSARLIEKRSEGDSLPIEAHFPEIFQDNPLPQGAVEVSRYIARHEDDMTQHTIALALIRTMTRISVQRQVEADYCLIEKPLVRLLGDRLGLPLEILGEPKYIDELKGILYPVRIDPYKILDDVTRPESQVSELAKYFFTEDSNTQGEGFYPAGLVGGYYE